MEITKEQILELADKCLAVKKILEKDFPEAFSKREFYLETSISRESFNLRYKNNGQIIVDGRTLHENREFEVIKAYVEMTEIPGSYRFIIK